MDQKVYEMKTIEQETLCLLTVTMFDIQSLFNLSVLSLHCPNRANIIYNNKDKYSPSELLIFSVKHHKASAKIFNKIFQISYRADVLNISLLPCVRLKDVPPPNSYVDVRTSVAQKATVFGYGVFKEILKIKQL